MGTTGSAVNRPFVERNFNTLASRDMFEMFCGELLGYGSARWVYANWMDLKTVVKMEPGDASFQNVAEWLVWDEFKDTPFGRKWLAPCLHISPCGKILIQKRTMKPGPNFKWPKRLPAIINDRKYPNFGMLGKRLVMHDYGILHRSVLMTANKTREDRVEWHEKKPTDPNFWADGKWRRA